MGCATSVAMVKTSPATILTRSGRKSTVVSEDMVLVFTESQKRLVRRTWKPLCNDMTGIGSKVFLRIFQLHPHVKQLFPCKDVEGETLLRDENFKGHASRFMQAVGAAVDNMDNLEASLSPLLIGLGRQHIHFKGFQPEYFHAFTSAMTWVWQQELQEKFTEEGRAAWRIVFEYIMSKLKEGFFLATEEKNSGHSSVSLERKSRLTLA